jgi:hypothetical protein
MSATANNRERSTETKGDVDYKAVDGSMVEFMGNFPLTGKKEDEEAIGMLNELSRYRLAEIIVYGEEEKPQ